MKTICLPTVLMACVGSEEGIIRLGEDILVVFIVALVCLSIFTPSHSMWGWGLDVGLGQSVERMLLHSLLSFAAYNTKGCSGCWAEPWPGRFLSQGSLLFQRQERCTLEWLEGENCFAEPLKKRFMVLRTMHFNHWKSSWVVFNFYSPIIFLLYYISYHILP